MSEHGTYSHVLAIVADKVGHTTASAILGALGDMGYAVKPSKKYRVKHDGVAEKQAFAHPAVQAAMTNLMVRITELEREVEYLRWYGNKDCTAMADAAMERGDMES